ncbi:hypothetical protein BC829DRAFT_384089, partial [Chytridium lagenaria]
NQEQRNPIHFPFVSNSSTHQPTPPQMEPNKSFNGHTGSNKPSVGASSPHPQPHSHPPNSINPSISPSAPPTPIPTAVPHAASSSPVTPCPPKPSPTKSGQKSSTGRIIFVAPDVMMICSLRYMLWMGLRNPCREMGSRLVYRLHPLLGCRRKS